MSDQCAQAAKSSPPPTPGLAALSFPATYPSALPDNTQAMNLFEIEIGRSYKCDRPDGQYFRTVKEKQDGQIGVVLGKVGTENDPGDPVPHRSLLGSRPSMFIPCDARTQAALLRRLPGPTATASALACRDGEILK
jgi:hypothetical protein